MDHSSGTLITVNGTTLYVIAEGDPANPPLLLCNGLGTTHDMWAPQMPAFAENFRVIRYDGRGHGRSAVPVGEYSLEQLSRDALGVLAHFGIDKAHFCGLSLGGAVGQWIAIHAPQNLNRLVLSNTAPIFGTPESWMARIKTVRDYGMGGIAETLLKRWFTDKFLEMYSNGVAPIRKMLMSIQPDGYIGGCAALRDMDLRSQVSSITAPTLVIGGLDDPSTTPRQSHDLAKTIKGAVLDLLPAAHLANYECPGDFTDVVIKFLRR